MNFIPECTGTSGSGAGSDDRDNSGAAGRSGILVSGNDALLITPVHGLPAVVALGLPEVPFINYGQHSLAALQVGGVNAVAALWFEWEDLESLKSTLTASSTASTGGAAAAAALAAAALARANRAATLGIYQQLGGLELFPGGAVSIKRIPVGKTVHRFAEILNRTDDRTQQALLEKKTFVLSCSEEVKRPFLPSVLTEEELQEDGELYERYFPNMDSFCQPDYSVGKAPAVSERAHTLALLQGSAVVDTYTLPPNECVVDVEVLYLTLEKVVQIPGLMMGAVRTTERRVFVAACTTIVEKRGEDTQGNGRLLLFSLDYALFEDDTTAAATAAAEEDGGGSGIVKTEAGDDEEKNGMDVATDVTLATKSTAVAATTATTTITSLSAAAAAQAKFLGAIKPKLRLAWSGPGPASVVRQLGEFVLSTVASTVYVYKYNPDSNELEQVSFFFAQVRIVLVVVGVLL